MLFMRLKHLVSIVVLLWVLTACDLSLPGLDTGTPATSIPTLESVLTPYIPPNPKPTNPAQTAQSSPGDVIGIGNAQALQAGAPLTENLAQSFSWLPDSEQVALAVDQGIMVYSLEAATVTNHLEALNPGNLTSSKQAQWLAWVSDENTIQVLNTQENRQVAEIHSPSGPVTSLSLASESGKLAFATFDNHLQVWAAQDGAVQLFKDWQLSYWLADLTFSPDGNILAGADLPNFQVHLIDLTTGEEIRSMQWTEHASPALYSVEFSPDWKYLAWVARGSVMIMDVDSGEPVATLDHEDFVSAVAWSSDGRLLATAAAGTLNGQLSPLVYLWDATGGKLINQLPQQGSVLSMSFSPDGRELAVLTSGGALQVWSVTP
jgi:WD40 repeat protein